MSKTAAMAATAYLALNDKHRPDPSPHVRAITVTTGYSRKHGLTNQNNTGIEQQQQKEPLASAGGTTLLRLDENIRKEFQ